MTDTSGASGHQKLRVCDVCGAYLSVLDSDRRLADHFGGKVRDMYVKGEKKSHVFDRCIWATTSCATCCPSSGRKERSARSPLCLLQRYRTAQVEVEARHERGASAGENTGDHVMIGTGTEGTSDTLRRDMSECGLSHIQWVLTIWTVIDEENEIGRDLRDVVVDVIEETRWRG